MEFIGRKVVLFTVDRAAVDHSPVVNSRGVDTESPGRVETLSTARATPTSDNIGGATRNRYTILSQVSPTIASTCSAVARSSMRKAPANGPRK